MAATTAALANAALAHLGVAGAITTLSSDTTTAGKVCREFLPRARQETLAAAPWQSAKAQATLSLVQTFAITVEQEWLHQYRLPEDCLTPRRIVWGVRNPTAEQEVPFALFADTSSTAWASGTAYVVGNYASLSGVWYRCILAHTNFTPPNATYWVAATSGPPKFLHTDQKTAILEYTMDLTDPTRFDPEVENAIIALLAFYIAPSVTVNASGVNLRGQVMGIWAVLTAQARTNDFNARQRDLPPMGGYRSVRAIGRR